jgi:molybdopterin converting factor subunit 1
MIKVDVQYFANFKDERGLDQETLSFESSLSAQDLFDDLQKQYSFRSTSSKCRVAINDDFVLWDRPLEDGDRVVFIPPVGGG